MLDIDGLQTSTTLRSSTLIQQTDQIKPKKRKLLYSFSIIISSSIIFGSRGIYIDLHIWLQFVFGLFCLVLGYQFLFRTVGYEEQALRIHSAYVLFHFDEEPLYITSINIWRSPLKLNKPLRFFFSNPLRNTIRKYRT